MRVVTLGPKGTFSEEAAKKFFGPIKIEFLSSIEEVFRGVNEDCTGVIPLENTLEGSIGSALDHLVNVKARIIGEIILPVNHDLCSKESANNVKAIISHPYAIAQCKRFLDENFPGIERKYVESTASAAEQASKNTGLGAICTKTAAKEYGLRVLYESIQDLKDNYTRFIVLGHEKRGGTGRDKTSIIFALKDAPGALYDALGVFASRNINLSKIESRPSKKALGEYLFFIDYDAHEDGDKEVLKELEEKCTYLKILGSYPRA